MSKVVNRPKQLRSQRTMISMLEAAETLLEQKSWQALTIQDVVSAAGCSVGAFYGRFKDKDGLLHALDERYFERLADLLQVALLQTDWSKLELVETVHRLARLVVTLHQEKQGVMRTLILQARLYNDARFREREARLRSYLPAIQMILLAHRDEIRHNDAETAVRYAYLQMYYSAREMLIWPHLTPTMPYQDDALIAALSHSFLTYLTVPPA